MANGAEYGERRWVDVGSSGGGLFVGRVGSRAEVGAQELGPEGLDETPVGPLAVYRHGSGLVGLCDACPHAGARLSGGAVEDGVVTCPAHGSRFELSTGERVRGPADQGVATYTVVQEEGRVWLVWI